MEKGNPIRSFKDLDAYKLLYEAMILVMKDIVPSLPNEEKFDLCDQMRRGCKAGPAFNR